ncbi:hypothetical protein ANCCAN_27971 [Ancylostoma caninum]|uniref:Uncharacterized protein n=1 Tax=Ancylostoma caninum TaxID=29170 RepID=A0A368F2I2_ANCCA|nr:hypothetical protein ANCCAN_27971 [Ancylostoma caninum]
MDNCNIIHVCFQPHSPSRLLSNGKFTKFDLKAHSISFTLEVQTEKKRKKGNANRVDTFVCEIKQFPTAVNPDSAEFEVSGAHFCSLFCENLLGLEYCG